MRGRHSKDQCKPAGFGSVERATKVVARLGRGPIPPLCGGLLRRPMRRCSSLQFNTNRSEMLVGENSKVGDVENENDGASGAAPISPRLFLTLFPSTFSLLFRWCLGDVGSLALFRNSGPVLENGEHGDSLQWDVESDFFVSRA